MSWAEKADVLYDADRWDEAGVALVESLRERPGDARAWYRLGNVRTHQHLDQDALDCFLRALVIAPADAQTLNNLGAACERLGRRGGAREAYENAQRADPGLFEPYLNLGRFWQSQGELGVAAGYLRAGLERHPDHPMLVHLLAAATNVQSPQAPRDHVASYFDGFAAEFDAHLGSLQYRIPAELAALVRPHLEPGGCAVDLGCGTGQVGTALAGAGLRLVGVDISPRMLDVARAPGVYAELLLADAATALQEMTPGKTDLVTAADVFIYIGDLRPVFEATARALRAGGLLAFSVETQADGEYRLLSSGRYSHAPAYLARLAAACGFEQLSARSVAIRRQGSGFAHGDLLLLRKA